MEDVFEDLQVCAFASMDDPGEVNRNFAESSTTVWD